MDAQVTDERIILHTAGGQEFVAELTPTGVEFTLRGADEPEVRETWKVADREDVGKMGAWLWTAAWHRLPGGGS